MLHPARRLLCAAALTTAAVATALGSGHAKAEEVTLKAISFVRLDDAWSKLFATFVDQVNKEGKGLVQINLVGGPEVIAQFEMGNAVKTGVVDMLQAPPAFYQGLFPPAQALSIAEKSSAEQRQNGAFDYLDELHQKYVNAKMLANYGSDVRYNLYLNKKIEKADLTGLKLRVVPTYRPLFTALGATTIQIAHAETFTALERGVVDGYGWSYWGVVTAGYGPVTKYRVEPAFYQVSLPIIVNLDKWKSLNQEQQALLSRIAHEFEANFPKVAGPVNDDEFTAQKAAGIQELTLPPDQAEKFLSLARESGWADVKANDPQDYEKLRSLLQ